MSCFWSSDQAVLVLRAVAPSSCLLFGSVCPSKYRVLSKAKPRPRVATVRTSSVRWTAALRLIEAAYFRSRRLAPICFIRHSTEVDAVQLPGAAEIRSVQLIRLRCGGSLREAENT